MKRSVPAHLLLIFLIGFLIGLQYANASLYSAFSKNLEYFQALNFLDMNKIKAYVQTLVSYGTRVTGYEGCNKAASFIYETLKGFGLNPYYENFSVTVPVDYGATLEIYSEDNVMIGNFTVYSLYPNLVETCTTSPKGIYGSIFYVGKGSLSDFDGRNVEGSIVIMDYNSQSNWINAAKLGAKAVIFLEPEECTSFESSQKYLNVPLDFPRVLVPKEKIYDLLSLLKQSTVYAKLKLKMEFEERTASNVVCFINGTDPQLKSDVIVISAYYDSYSVVPSLAPGAEESIGVSVLLEIARFFSFYPPKRSLLILALSGHNQALAGIRTFVNDHFSDIISNDGGKSWKYKLLINLDLSSENDVIGVFYWGYFYAFQKVISRFEVVKVIFSKYLPDIQLKTGKTPKIMDCILMSLPRGTMYTQYMFDSEPFTLAGGIGVTFATTQTLKTYQNTFHDTIDRLNFSNIMRQAEDIICVISAFSNDDTLILPSVTPFKYDDRMGGFASLKGQVLEYNYTTGWFTPVPNALVYVQGYPVEPYVCGQDMYGNNLPLYRHEFYVKTDSQGNFIIHGVVPRTAYVNMLGDFSYIFEAYVDEPSYGSVDYAPDYGKYATLPKKVLILSEMEEIYPVIFKCGTMAIYDLLHPSSLTPLPGLFLEVNSFSTHFAFDHYGYTARTYTTIPSPVMMVFVPPQDASEIIIRSAIRTYPTGFLINTSETYPLGLGFKINAGECIHLTPIQIAIDMHRLNEERLKIVSSHGITLMSNETQEIQNRYNFLHIFISKNEKKFGARYSYAFAVWAYEFSRYADVKTLIQDASDTIVFFTLMLIPFSFLLEILLLEHQNILKRSLSVGAIMASFLFVLGLSHPGFEVSPNAPLVLMGFTIACLITPALIILFWKSWGYIKEFRIKFLGKHLTEISRTSAMLLAFSIGISNMRRRKMRTTLAIISLTLIAFALVSFSSFPTWVIKILGEFEGKTEYNGLLIRDRSYAPISNEAISIINETVSNFNGIIIPRAYKGGSRVVFGPQGKNYTIEGILGLKPEEPIKVYQAMRGKWFASSDEYECIIPDEVAVLLNITVGDQIRISNICFSICGLFNQSEVDNMVDLDQNSIIPIPGGRGAGVGGIGGGRMESKFIVIIPYDLAILLGANTYTLAVQLQDLSYIDDMLQILSSNFPELNVYSGLDGKICILQYTRHVLMRIETLIVPFILVFLSIFNLMLAMVHERTKEIGIYSSIGLSPLHIVGMFLSEAILYSVLSSMFGYTIGIVGIYATKILGIEAGFVPNYSSSIVINSVELTMLAILTSVAYPFYKASKIVTPSLERKWKMPTKPKGDEWEIPLPFTVEESARKGLLCYIKEYVESFPVERVSLFSASNISYHEKNKVESLDFIARLSPYEAGIRQLVSLRLIFNESDRKYHISIFVKRLEGILHVWRTANRPFINDIRRQLLNWQSLSDEEKKKYQSNYLELYAVKDGE
jgi:hypothetical protein